MPTYEYRCKSCGGVFEVEQRITDPVIEDCQLCANGKVERLISGSSFVLKGTGWYKTDYASSGSSRASSTATKPQTTTTSSETDKTPAKTEATTPVASNSVSNQSGAATTSGGTAAASAATKS